MGQSAFIPLSELTTPGNGRGPVGAVMVVGGGIAGMQASLDLAEQGFKVYLVETKSAIGGHMAQLDKTFPTNDCAMCTISPKLVETGRHLNIEILTNTEVLGVEGEAGDFTARLRRKPRYIDPLKCVGCGDCEKVCPIVLPDDFNEGLAPRRAAYRLYPQAIPAAYAIEKKGIAPCRDACPAGQRAQGYIALIREGRYADALRVIKEDNPFPGICGRICNHRCELACNRNLVDEPLNIHALKRFVADWAYAKDREPIQRIPQARPQRVAVIGAGPCGLTAAKDLVTLGYGATVFEALPVAGGMLRVGVPEYRLPSAIVDREVQDIVDLGVDLRLNTTVNNLDDLFAQGYDAVLIAVGAHEGKKLPIPGADLPDVLVNTQFLRDVRLAEIPNPKPQLPITNYQSRIVGKRILVLGGGNVAIDCARTAVRLGAASVAMACLESREKMPAHPWEIEEAEAEGVTMYPARSFKQILNDEGRVTGVECVNVTFMEFDSEGKLTLETEPGSEHVLPCDTVIFSIGQRAGLAFIPDDAGVGVTRQATIAVNPNTFAATRPGVFAAGDATTGTAFVIEAVASGHKVAATIHRYLSGEPLEPKFAPDLPVVKMTRPEVETKLVRNEIRVAPRVPMPMIPVERRRGTFAEVEQGYTEEQAKAEASRCLACGICSECLSCVYVCGAKAINHDEVERIEEVKVGAVILAPGYQAYNAKLSQEFGFGRYPNVVTALQFERLLSASGPTGGHVKRPSDGASPKKIAFLQCVGSRDQTHDYCSSVCCMYAAKEAIMAVEHAKAEGHDGQVQCQVFFMDTRAFSKGYEEYYRRAEKKYGVKYTRCRISALKEDPETHDLVLRYAESDQSLVNSDPSSPVTDHCSLITDHFDLVVLSVGMEISDAVKKLGHDLGIELDAYGFCHTTFFDPLQSSRPGIYVAGPFREPKDIPETVMEASGAAAAAARQLAPARFTLTRQREYAPERAVSGEPPRVGVFVCHCGSNIGGYLDVPGVAEWAKSLPGVVHAENNLYTCSQDSIKHIIERVKELKLNRVVVASCTPRTHEPLFQDAIRQAGLNPYLFEMANIRNQCSWVHPNDWDGATAKAKTLVRMAAARAAELEPLQTSEVPIKRAALIIGGGAAGMNAALALAEQGFPVHLVERSDQLGGNLRHLHYLPTTADGRPPTVVSGRPSAVGSVNDPQAYLAQLIERVTRNPLITVYLQTELVEAGGFKGNFTSTLKQDGQTFRVEHGATIVATGGVEYKGPEYHYGKDPRIVTQLEFEALLADGRWQIADSRWQIADGKSQIADSQLPSAISHSPSAIRYPLSVVMIQCVGPGEKFCARLCCSTALKNALKLKELSPQAQVTILYRDIRAYGFKERLYTEARRAGVRFVRYDFDRKPVVEIQTADDRPQTAVSGPPSAVVVKVWEPILGAAIELRPDLLVLSTPIVPPNGARELASRLKVPLDMDGFFLEAHPKLRPVDFASDGLFMAGVAHYPKFLDETIAQAQAAAARAAIILAQDSVLTNARVAVVDAAKCVGCLTCVRACPYDVPKVSANFAGVGNIVGAAFIEPAMCHGCGICAAECPAKAIQLRHYRDAEMLPKIDALFGLRASVISDQLSVASEPSSELITGH
jgi:heterodisulfide reductase subunit A-like polyferredoxin